MTELGAAPCAHLGMHAGLPCLVPILESPVALSGRRHDRNSVSAQGSLCRAHPRLLACVMHTEKHAQPSAAVFAATQTSFQSHAVDVPAVPFMHSTMGLPTKLKIADPACVRSLERYAGLMNRAAGRLVQRLDRAASSGEVVNLWRHLGDLTLDVVGMSAFGCAAL